MKTRLILDTAVSVCLGIAICIVVLAISFSNKKQIDVTKNGRYTLSEQSLKAVDNLATPIKLIAFVDERTGKKKAEDLVQRYKIRHPEKIEAEFVDPYKRPRLAQKYDIRQPGTIIVEAQAANNTTTPRIERVATISEQDITNALMRMTRVQESKVYVLTGHNEKALDGKGADSLANFQADLSKEGMTLEPINLVKDKLPETAKVLMIAGPRGNLLAGEDKAIRDFLAHQGSLFLMLDPDSPESYVKLAKDYGFDSPPEVIIDEASQMIGAEPIFAVAFAYDQAHPITQDFKQNAVFRLARPVSAANVTPPNSKVSWLAQTAPTAFTISSEQMGKEVKIDPSKVKHVSINLAAVGSYPKAGAPPAPPTPGAAAPPKQPEARIVVVGDSDFVSNALFRQAPGNRDFALNILNWLAQSENQISIRPTEAESLPLRLTQADMNKMFVMHVVAIPMAVIGMGLFLAFRRR